MVANRIIGGMNDRNTEFYTNITACNKMELKCSFDRQQYDFADLPECRKQILRDELSKLPVQREAYISMVGPDEDRVLEKFGMCWLGALNDEADINEAGAVSGPEYVPCTQRGVCDQEGVGCCNIIVNDVFLSKMETRIFRLVHLENDVIASLLFISEETVKKHFKNIRQKTGLKNKIEMAIYATRKGII